MLHFVNRLTLAKETTFFFCDVTNCDLKIYWVYKVFNCVRKKE
jgi:hypothetical protein